LISKLISILIYILTVVTLLSCYIISYNYPINVQAVGTLSALLGLGLLVAFSVTIILACYQISYLEGIRFETTTVPVEV